MKTTKEIRNYENLIDSRDINDRIEYLEAEETLLTAEKEELVALKSLASEGRDYSEDWEYGSTLIRDTYFEDYAQELAEDCGMINNNYSWPHTCIDWEKAARKLQVDYTSIDFDGIDYWIR